MKALSIQQPWPYAIFCLGKAVENRTWPTKFRGRFQIHAGKKMDKDGVAWLRQRGFDVPDDLPLGAFVGEATLTDCVEECDLPIDSEWAFGRFCFLLADAEPYAEPVPGKGALGFFESDTLGTCIE